MNARKGYLLGEERRLTFANAFDPHSNFFLCPEGVYSLDRHWARCPVEGGVGKIPTLLFTVQWPMDAERVFAILLFDVCGNI